MTSQNMSSDLWSSLQLDRAGPAPLYVQLHDAIAAELAAGRLPPGSRLPPVRALARRLGLNVNTVVSAYRLLDEEGLTEAHAAKGTFVRAAPGGARTAEGAAAASRRPRPVAPAGERASLEAAEVAEDRSPRWIPAVTPEAVGPWPPPRDALRPAPAAGIIPLDGGTPAEDLFPVDAFRGLFDAILAEEGPGVMQYAGADGDPALRAAAAQVLRGSGVPVEADDLLVTTGAQQGIDLVARALLAPGDAVVVEAPTYPGALASFERIGCRLLPLPMTPDGPRLDDLPALLARHRPRLVYTVPTFHNPTGWTMGTRRREQLVTLATEAGAFVLEDDHLSDLLAEGEAPLPLKALDRAGLVIHVRGFAKTVMPGLRLGVLAPPPALRRRLLALKLAADLYPPPLEQRALARFLVGGYRAHLARLRAAYRARRDHALARLAALGIPELTVVPPAGGLNLWVGLPPGISAAALQREALAAGVAVAPGGLFYPDWRDGDGFIRLSYGGVTEEQLAEGIARLDAALGRLRRAAGAPAAAVPLV